jgi:hypothetical protein
MAEATTKTYLRAASPSGEAVRVMSGHSIDVRKSTRLKTPNLLAAHKFRSSGWYKRPAEPDQGLSVSAC